MRLSSGSKRSPVLLFVLLALGTSGIWAQSPAPQSPAQKVQISFTYSSVSGFSSNQYAIWIENEKGEYVRTIYVTKYTAVKGWKKYAEALPSWVKKSGIASMPKDRVDVISGATPKSGKQTYLWDFTDGSGKPVPDGAYTLVIEALNDGNAKTLTELFYRATVTRGSATTVTAGKSELSGTSERGRDMISAIQVELVH